MSDYLKTPLEQLPEKVQALRHPDVRLPSPVPNSQRSITWRAKHSSYSLLGFVTFLLFRTFLRSSGPSPLPQEPLIHAKEENPILNRTLGFQDIFMLSLPDRSDRRAPLLAGANATNLTVTVIDAIRDRQIPQSDYPIGWQSDGWVAKEGELGCLMSHLRTWRKIIYENITSALIMESDVDWDMRIKQTMVGIGKGAKAIADWPFDPEPEEAERAMPALNATKPQPRPYGDKWDLLWIGHCGSAPNDGGRLYHFNDSAAPDEEHAWTYGTRPDSSLRPYGTRLVYHAKQSVCTTAYAISNRGARKLERTFRHANGPIDIKLWDKCENDPRFTCVGVWPQVITMAESRTNIKHTEGGFSFGHEILEEKVMAGQGIQVSSRVNAYLQQGHLDEAGWKWEWKPRNRTMERIKKLKKLEEDFDLEEAPFHTERPPSEEEVSAEENEREKEKEAKEENESEEDLEIEARLDIKGRRD